MRRTSDSTIPIRPYRLVAALFGYFWLAQGGAFGASREVAQPSRVGTWTAALALTAVTVLFGRQRLNPRSSTASIDSPRIEFPKQLAEAFSQAPVPAVPRERSDEPNFRFLCVGRRKPLDQSIEDEIYGIGRDALLNAFQHSRARNIEIAVTFCSDSLRVVVRDDGCGIEPDLVTRTRDAYRGLAGMRDRAERIGGRLRLRSAPRRGTELELRVPIVFPMQSLKTEPAGQGA